MSNQRLDSGNGRLGNGAGSREAPPQGTFPGKDLGPVMIQLRTPFEDSGRHERD